MPERSSTQSVRSKKSESQLTKPGVFASVSVLFAWAGVHDGVKTCLRRYQRKQQDFGAVLGKTVSVDLLKASLSKAIAYPSSSVPDEWSLFIYFLILVVELFRDKKQEVKEVRVLLEKAKMSSSSLAGEEKSMKARLDQLERQLKGKWHNILSPFLICQCTFSQARANEIAWRGLSFSS